MDGRAAAEAADAVRRFCNDFLAGRLDDTRGRDTRVRARHASSPPQTLRAIQGASSGGSSGQGQPQGNARASCSSVAPS